MAHNISNRKRRDAVLGLGIGELAKSALAVGCPRCRRRSEVPIAALVGRYGGYGADHRLMAIVNRLRCRTPACGSPPNSVVLTCGGDAVVLVEPGAH